MAIYADDFQGYAIGASSPFGSLIQTGFFASTIVTSPTGIYGKSKCVSIPSISTLELTTIGYVSSVSIFFGAEFPTWDNVILRLRSDGVELGSIRREFDGTISIYVGSTLIANSGDKSLKLNKKNWFQVNFSWNDVAGFVFIDAAVAVDEELIVFGNISSSISSGSLTSVGVNKYEFGEQYYLSELTIDTPKSIGVDPNPGSPVDRTTQALIELQQVPDSTLVRVTQGIIEIEQLPNTAKVRVTQGIIELYIAKIRSQGWQIYEA